MENFSEGIRTTKYFGNVELEYDSDPDLCGCVSFWTILNGQGILVSIYDYNNMGNKINLCWEIIDKYYEITKIAKNAIIENFQDKTGTVNHYFKYNFDKIKEKNYGENIIDIFGVNDFEKINIQKIMEEISYPCLSFHFKDSVFSVSIDFTIIENARIEDDVILCVLMDKKLKVIGYEIYYEL